MTRNEFLIRVFEIGVSRPGHDERTVDEVPESLGIEAVGSRKFKPMVDISSKGMKLYEVNVFKDVSIVKCVSTHEDVDGSKGKDIEYSVYIEDS